MDTHLNLPIMENLSAKQYGFATKLIPFFIDGVQTAWEQVHVNDRRTATRRDSAEVLRAAGFKVPYVDYDPILNDRQKRCPVFKPHWMGD